MARLFRLATLLERFSRGMAKTTAWRLRPTLPEPEFILSVHDYDWGPQCNPQDGSGIASNAPPRIKQVLKMFAPKVDADGNELGGVPVVLLDAPLGTYLGWNVTPGLERHCRR
ncbi:MAG: alpha/beta hydrolase domain-containing protein [Burkholderiales bacterium]